MSKKCTAIILSVFILLSQFSSIALFAKNNLIYEKNGLVGEYFRCSKAGIGVEAFNFDNKTGENLVDNIDLSNQLRQSFATFNGTTEYATARFTGSIKPECTDKYTFYMVGDDGFRMCIDDELVIDFWRTEWDKPQQSQEIKLKAGVKYDFKVEYLQSYGNSYLKLEWSGNKQKRQIVPKSVFFLPESYYNFDKASLSDELSSKIDKSKYLLDTISIGTDSKQTTAEEYNNFEKSLNSAIEVLNDSNSSEKNLTNSYIDLDKAMSEFLLNTNPMSNSELTTFNNPLYQGQDPFVTYKDGYYYYVSSSNLDSNNKKYVSKSKTLTDQGEKIEIFDSHGDLTRIYAPEIFFIDGKWYIYFCADYMQYNGRHYAGVLESVTDDAQGEYIHKGALFTGENGVNQQANDFTVFEYDGQLYGTWGTFVEDPVSYSPGIVKMDSPYEITQDRSLLPERGGEGPRVLKNKDKIYLTVSMGGFADKGYYLSTYIFEGPGDILDKKNWTFKDNIFRGTKDVYGAGRASFVKSPDGTQDWMMYHSKVYEATNNSWRQVHIQEFLWEDDKLVLGKPISPLVTQNLPSGDPGIGKVYQAEDALLLNNAIVGNQYQGFQGDGYVNIANEFNSEISFIIDAEQDADNYLRMRYAYGEKVEGEYDDKMNTQIPARAKLSVYVNGKYVTTIYPDKTGISWESWFTGGERLSLQESTNITT